MPIKFSFKRGDAAEYKGDILAVLLQGGKVRSSLTAGLKSEIEKVAARLNITGGAGKAETLVWRHGGLDVPVVALIGLPEEGNKLARAEGLRRSIGQVVKEVRGLGGRKMGVDLGGWPDDAGSLPAALGAMVDGAVLANYRFTEHSREKASDQERRSLLEIVFIKGEVTAELRQAVARQQKVMQGVRLARDLVNRPAEEITPVKLSSQARKIANSSKRVKVKIIEEKEARRLGFGAYLAVARGSEEIPQLIHLTYKPEQKTAKKVVIVGKGITFDSGGLNLKHSQGMASMKMDMAGAAAVLGFFSIIEDLKVPVAVEGIIAACENMPSGKAYRPGDILRAKNGTTIEVIDTDAEGRLTLADALSWAAEKKPDAIVDLATLTGACMVALGETVAGLWSNRPDLAAEIEAASAVSGEQVADLPMPDEYRPLLDSPVADLRNLGTSRLGDAILAAMFLREFVGGVPWAHLDIAGPSFCESERISYWGKGATGFGVRLLADWLGAEKIN